MDIRIYDFDFNLVQILPRIASYNWTIYYNKIGTLEIHTAPSGRLLSLLRDHKYLLITHGAKQGVITSYQLDKELVIFGRTVNWLMTKRVVLPFKVSKIEGLAANAESLCRYLVTQAYMTDRSTYIDNEGNIQQIVDADGNPCTLKKQDNFILAPPTGSAWEESNYWRTSTNTLSECVIEYLNYIHCGHKLSFDTVNKQWIFTIYQGTIRRALLSSGNRTAADSRVTNNRLDYCNSGFYNLSSSASDDAGGTTTVSEYRYVANDISEDTPPILRFEAGLSGSSLADAKTSLAAKKTKKEISTATQRLVYGKDYQLGDVLQHEMMIDGIRFAAKMRISGIEFTQTAEKPILEEVSNEL